MRKIDDLLNSITMYRLVLYYLIFLVAIAFIYSIFHLLPFQPLDIVFSTGIFLGVCYVTNSIFRSVFKIQTNVESFLITALILVLIVTPKISFASFEVFATVSFIAMASKYVLNIGRKHIFNPAVVAVVLMGLLFHQYASWWIATKYMFPFLVLGFLIVRKIRREKFIFVFLVISTLVIILQAVMRGNMDVFSVLKLTYFDSPILFFAFVMLTEPLTTPPTKLLQYMYAGIVGIFFVPFEIGSFFTNPEIALSIGNIFSYVVSPKVRLALKLKEKLKLTNTVYDFIFEKTSKFDFISGQYMEWTLGHKNTDSRGSRRYFTLASSPTEENVRVGVKFQEGVSSFKKNLLDMRVGDEIVAAQIMGDFVLPKDSREKLVFIAGGIGVTPFRSMIKYLIDKQSLPLSGEGEKRDIVLIYSEKRPNDFVYKDVFTKALEIGVKVHYVATEVDGRIDEEKIKRWIPDFKTRTFYLSGPHGMVKYFEEVLEAAGLSPKRIKVDYFPGFA